MDLGTLFKLSLYSLIAFAGLILGAAEGEGIVLGNARSELYLPYLSLPLVICGYLFTERRTRGLGAIFANVLGIIALAATAYQFNSENREGKLLAGTHLLLYVNWIVLFQQKSVRSYWFLMALGILQLAIASVLTKSGWFGFSAIGYMFAAVWTLSIFSLWRAEQLFEEENRKHPSLTFNQQNGSQGDSTHREQIASEVRGSVQHEDGAHWLTPRFVSGVLMMTLSALLVSTAFFAFIPRVWVGSDFSYQDDRSVVEKLGAKTGLATSVKLGNLDSLLVSSERVFEIQLTNLHTEQNIPVQEYAELLGLAEPLFRGAVLTYYDKGKWTYEDMSGMDGRQLGLQRREYDVRQDIRMEQNGSHVLFCLGRPRDLRDPSGNRVASYQYHRSSGVVTRLDTGPLEYSVFTDLPATQTSFKLRGMNELEWGGRRSNYLERCSQIPDSLTALVELARDVVKKETARINRAESKSESRELTLREKAEALEFFLRETGGYRYSLEASIQDVKRDPVEDFLFNRKTGNCEYFASALALMMRAVKIPARIVSGYKGGIEHPDKRSFQFEVQQRFSHLWVEAWVDQTDPGWTTFDATPADARLASLANFTQKKPSVWSEMQTTLSGLWSENVLNMSLDRQEQSIYKPLRELAFSLATFFQQLFTSPQSAFETLAELFRNRDQWLSIGGGIFVFVLLILTVAIVKVARIGFRSFCDWSAKRSNRRHLQQRRIVMFYEKFLKFAEMRGLKRAMTETQREFGERVAMDLLPELSPNGLRDVPEKISQFFYRVRFGDEDLTAEDLNQLEQSLTEFEQALKSHTVSRS